MLGRGAVDERELEREIAGLYQRPLAEFIAARSDIEARLREGGDPRSADRVKRLRKPSLSAWTIDQLTGRDRGDLAALLTLGNELRAAQCTPSPIPRARTLFQQVSS